MKNDTTKITPTSIRIDREMLPIVEEMRQATDWSMSDFLRETIKFYISHHKIEKRKVTTVHKELVRISA